MRRGNPGRLVPLLIVLFTCCVATWQAPPTLAQEDLGFRFVRISYGDEDRGGGRRGWGRRAPWAHDYPTAELNFYEALKRTTRIEVTGDPVVLSLKDERIFEYPVLYLCEPGYWTFDEEDVTNLRRYLERGGFILFDDFRGGGEWQWFASVMKEVLPDRQPEEIDPDHPIWSIYYDIDPVAAPSNVSGGFGPTDDRYIAFFDEDGRMVALACFNQDIGDGWEWPERNFANASTVSFQMGINFVIYALTH